MTPLEATNAILNHAIANWNAADAVLTFDGERFDAPEGEPWIRLTIRDLPTASVTLGARANRLAERRAQRASEEGRADLIPPLPTPEATESDWGAFDSATRGGAL